LKDRAHRGSSSCPLNGVRHTISLGVTGHRLEVRERLQRRDLAVGPSHLHAQSATVLITSAIRGSVWAVVSVLFLLLF
jgi:hypothetical protein